MSGAYVPRALRERVAAAARYRCGYCLTAEKVCGARMVIDHIIPESRGGPTVEENLWLACALCNVYKGDQIVAVDSVSGEAVRLFDPRHQRWAEHFAWTGAGDEIVGLTATGRATVAALRLNRPELVAARRAWVAVGWHPPKD